MRFVKIFNQGKFTLISVFLFLYVGINLFDGERGLISYYEKKEIIKDLDAEKKSILFELKSVEKKNSLLTQAVDLDYLETLYRQKFMVGKSSEKVYYLDRNDKTSRKN